MKELKKRVAYSIGCALFFVGCTSSYANVSLSMNFSGVENVCASIVNSSWAGTGKASGVIDCNYKGTGKVVGSAPNYKLQISAEKSGGSFLCPKSVDTTLNAACSDNNITIYSDNVNLKGSFNGPNQINASGTVGVSGVTDKLTISVNRTG